MDGPLGILYTNPRKNSKKSRVFTISGIKEIDPIVIFKGHPERHDTLVCKIPLLARALGLKAECARPSARATIGYLVYK